MTSRQRFSPLCDLHHVPMRRVMREEDSEEVRSYHACIRRDCTRAFRGSNGYSDWAEGEFDDSRISVRKCPICGTATFLAQVNQDRKIETWECPQKGCDFSEQHPSPSGR
jgi:ribosomal protein S27AE